MLVGSDRRARGRLLVAGAVAALAVLLVVPAMLGSGPVSLDERTVTKLDFGILRQQLETQEGSGGVRSSLLSDGLGLVAETDGLGVGAGNAERQVRSLANFPAWRTSTTGGWRCWSTAGSWASPSTCSST